MSVRKINTVAVLTVALPLFAIVASVGTAVVAVSRGDPPLPDQYHWEGDKLDHDFAQSSRAVALHLDATLDLRPDEKGVCHLTLTLDGNTAPPSVEVALIHVSKPALDRRIQFARTSAAPLNAVRATSWYTAPCSPLPAARWHVELSDPERSWSFRSATDGQKLQIIVLSPSSPGDNSSWP